jgi:sodium-dependent dicarboxylate transporter 2/3/5
LQESNLHKRLALNTVKLIGTNPVKLVLGFMVATAFLSMWISNTSSVMVMMPIAISIIDKIAEHISDHKTD